METFKKVNKVKTIFSVIVLIWVAWFFLGGGIENHVAKDAEKQYEIAKKGGDKMQTYVQASLVTAAYLQANDEANYSKWLAIEKEEAKNAGMPTELINP